MIALMDLWKSLRDELVKRAGEIPLWRCHGNVVYSLKYYAVHNAWYFSWQSIGG